MFQNRAEAACRTCRLPGLVGLRVYEYRNGTVRSPMATLEADEGYRPRPAGDAAWPPPERAYGGPVESLWSHLAGPLTAAGRLAVPVLLLATLLGAAYLYSDAVLPLAGAPRMVRGAMLAVSDLVLPAAWYAIHLANRRYGAPYAFAQLIAGLMLAGLLALLLPGGLGHWLHSIPAVSPRAMLAFGAAFFLANFVAIAFFDGARGPRWWTAPLAASFAASLVFSAVYYPAAFAGEVAWADSALVHFGAFFAESVLLLLPYWLLRPAMPPMAGLNGY
jgi:uncharacterized PurR-regulated membrane protein YhhQ (DUF165 family)